MVSGQTFRPMQLLKLCLKWCLRLLNFEKCVILFWRFIEYMFMDSVRNHIGHDLKYSSIYFILKLIHLKRLYVLKTAKKWKKPSYS